jgi:hypothetical protein
MIPSIMAPKIPILVSQCEMDHQKPSNLLIFSTLSLGGCGGHPMSLELDLKAKSQMSRPNEYTNNFQSNSICIFTSVRAKSKKPLCPRTQCISKLYTLLVYLAPESKYKKASFIAYLVTVL